MHRRTSRVLWVISRVGRHSQEQLEGRLIGRTVPRPRRGLYITTTSMLIAYVYLLEVSPIH